MNLTEATSVTVNGKSVRSILLNGRKVYEKVTMSLSSSKEYILTDESVTVNLESNLIGKEVELFKVIGMTRESLGSKTTGSDGKASWSYTGVGAGTVGFVAVYDGKDSNTVTVDDYVPAVTTIELGTDKSAIISGQSVLLTATVKDQHGELMPSGTVTFKVNGTSVGTGSISGGVATLTTSSFSDGVNQVTAEVGSVSSDIVNVSVLRVALTIGITGSSFHSNGVLYDSPFIYTGGVVIDWGDGTTTEYTGGQLAHTYASSGNYEIKVYGDITAIKSTAFYNRAEIVSVTIGSSITTLGNGIFVYCTGLTSVNVSPSVTSIGNSCFAYGTALTEIVLEWGTASSIVTYDSSWIGGCSSFDHFLIPEGTTALYTAKNYPSNLLREVTSYDGMSLGLSAGSQILSYADEQRVPDSQFATVTAQLLDGQSSATASNVPVVFGAYQNDVLITGSEQTVNTDSNGQASYTYHSAGRGDVVVKAVPDNRTLLTKTFVVQDCNDYISGETDQSTKFGSSITLRTGSSTLSYDSTNKHYILTVGTAGESFLPVNSCTGLDDFTLEFDAQVNYNSAYGVGSVIYSASNNWGAIGVHQQSCTYGKTVNGTYTYSSETVSITGSTWLHFKITVTDDKVKLEILNGTTLISSHTETYDSSWFSNSTKYGLDHMWSSGRATPFKNIKVKPL